MCSHYSLPWRQVENPINRRQPVDINFTPQTLRTFNAICLLQFNPARSKQPSRGITTACWWPVLPALAQSLEGNTVQRQAAMHKSIAGQSLLYRKGLKHPVRLSKRAKAPCHYSYTNSVTWRLLEPTITNTMRQNKSSGQY